MKYIIIITLALVPSLASAQDMSSRLDALEANNKVVVSILTSHGNRLDGIEAKLDRLLNQSKPPAVLTTTPQVIDSVTTISSMQACSPNTVTYSNYSMSSSAGSCASNGSSRPGLFGGGGPIRRLLGGCK